MTVHDLAGLPDPYPVAPVRRPLDVTVMVPGSKSVTNRALVCAALATGTSRLTGALLADDTEAMLGVLRALGLAVAVEERDVADGGPTITVTGCAGAPPVGAGAVDVRQSGTTARFALPMLALGRGSYRVAAHPQMAARPMDSTFDALRGLGARVEAQDRPGHLPATVTGGGLRGGVARVRGDVSSQFLSGLLLVGPCLADGLVVELTSELVSRPYVELTLAVMAAFGARTEVPDPHTFVVRPGGYRATDHAVEPDASAASYPLAAAAVCGGRVRIEGLGAAVRQGDVRFVEILAAMGASVSRDPSGTEVRAEAGTLRGGTFDLADISDTAQTLAMVAVGAREPVRVTGIGFIRRKEIDRVEAVARELGRLGVVVDRHDDGWTVHPGTPRPGVVETSDDHRMAMSFALLGLANPGIEIAGPGCVAKTFPGYWAMLDRLRAGP